MVTLHVRIFDEGIEEVGGLNQGQVFVSQRQNAAIDANADTFSIRRVRVLREMTSVIIGLSAGIPATSIGSRSGRGGHEGAVGFYASATPCAVLKTLEELPVK